jgi:hypothetical protein
MSHAERDRLWTLLQRVNVPSADNGRDFYVRDRINVLLELLAPTPWELIHDGRLAFVFAQPGYRDASTLDLVSCHIDSLYPKHFQQQLGADYWQGTFDNSICNMLLLDLMCQGQLPSHVVVTFTGDEEQDSRGAQETIEFFQRDVFLWQHLQRVITLDVTPSGFGKPFTVENWFVESEPLPGHTPAFDSQKAFRRWIKQQLPWSHMVFVHERDAAPDESWEYEAYDLNCFSLCLPVAPPPEYGDDEDWMEIVTRARTDSFAGFQEALLRIVKARFPNT